MSTEHGASTGTPAEREYTLITSKMMYFRVQELKELCRSTGLTIIGRKSDIQDRLFQFVRSLCNADKKIEIMALRASMAKLAFSPGIPALNQLVSAIRQGPLPFPQVVASVTRYEAIVETYGFNCSISLVPGMPSNVNAFHIISNNQISSMPGTRSSSSNSPVNAQFALWHAENARQLQQKAQQQQYNNVAVKPYYTGSLFYTLRHSVGSSHTLTPSKGRALKEFVIGLSPARGQLLQDTPTARLFLFCCTSASAAKKPAVISYPPIEIYIDGVLIKQNIRGLKGKKGSARPADITSYINFDKGFSTVRIVYSDAEDRFIIDTHIVDVISPDSIMTSIMGKPHIPYSSTVKMLEEENMRSMQDDDIVVENVPLSLRCPITYARIKYPVKSTQCDHVQCFDGLSFLTMQERIPVWQCPVCSKSINENSLAVSDYLQHILDNTIDDVDTVVLNADGSWTPVHEDNDATKKHDDEEQEQSSRTKSESVSAAPTAPAEQSIEIISLDSDSEPEMETEQNQPVAAISGEPDANPTNDVTMNPHENSPSSASHLHAGAGAGAGAAENTSLIDTTMQEETLNPTAPTDDANASSDDEVIVSSNQRKRARLSPEPRSPLIETQSARAVSDETNAPGKDNIPAVQNANAVTITPSSTASDESVSRSLEDVPISQYLAQRNIQHREATRGSTEANNMDSGRDIRSSAFDKPAQSKSPISPANGSKASAPDHSIVPPVKETATAVNNSSSSPQDPPVSVPNVSFSVPMAQTTSSNAASTPVTKQDTSEFDATKNVESNNPIANNRIQTSSAQEKASASDSGASQIESRALEAHQVDTTSTAQKGSESVGLNTGNQKPSDAQVVLDVATAQKPQDFDEPTTRAFGVARNTTQQSPLTRNAAINDSSIPVVWQNKENHPKGLERLPISKLHQNQASSFPRVLSPNISNNGQVDKHQRPQVSPAIDPKTVPSGPAIAKPGDEVSIIEAIHDQISRACSPRPDFVQNGLQKEASHKTPSHSSKTSESGAPLQIGSNGNSSTETMRTQVEPENVGSSKESQPNASTDPGAVAPTNHHIPSSNTPQVQSMVPEIRVPSPAYGNSANLDLTKGGVAAPLVSPGADSGRDSSHRSFNNAAMEFALAHTRGQYDNDLGRYASDTHMNNAHETYRARQKYAEMQSRMASGYGARQSQSAIGSRYSGPNPPQEVRGPQLAVWNINHQGKGGMENIQQISPQARQTSGTMRALNSTHGQNVRYSSEMIHAYQRSLSESGSEGLNGNLHHGMPGLMRHTSLQFPVPSGTTDAPKPGTPVSPYPPAELRSHTGPSFSHVQQMTPSGMQPRGPGLNPNSELAARQSFGRAAAPLQHLIRKEPIASDPSNAIRQSDLTSSRAVHPDVNGLRYSKTAFDNIIEKNTQGRTVRGILGIELSKDAFQPTRESTPVSPSNGIDRTSPIPNDDNIGETSVNPNTTFSPLNDRIEDMMIQTPTSKKRSISGDEAMNERTWNKRLSKQGSNKNKFDPSSINQSDIIELDD